MDDLPAGPAAETFEQSLGDLVSQVRAHPGDHAAYAPALSRVVGWVAGSPAAIEAGIENSWSVDGDDLRGRLLSRGVDAIRVSAGASRDDLLALAQALAEDEGPLPSTPGVQVDLIPTLGQILGTAQGADGEFGLERTFPRDLPPLFSKRIRRGDRLAATLGQLLDLVQAAVRRSAWLDVLHNAQAVLRLHPGIPEGERRGYILALRRILTRPVLQALIEQAYRVSEERPRTVELLRLSGLDAVEVMLENLRTSEAIGPRAFLVDALGGMPDAYSLVAALLSSERWSDLRLAADLLGRLGDPRAIPGLLARADHPDERVRLAVIDALGRFRDKRVVDGLRQLLSHPSPRTRAQAGKSLAGRHSAAIAMPLLIALDQEKDRTVRVELLQALAGIDAPEARAVLVKVATERRGLLGRGRPTSERLEVVSALASAKTEASRQALSRIAAEADGQVRDAAVQALDSHSMAE
ncbi:MAG TPA: HEAT repeat domain-containing protein [Gemmatimonadales bacterium]|nr:HEAT repeat domain-containing protein [Gemmatimonadales bacterium]